MKILFLVAGLFMSQLFVNQLDSLAIPCGDLLEEYAERPDQLDFISCEHGEFQTIVKATYRVKGKDAKDVEKFLVEHYGMGKLIRRCEGWEIKDYGYIKNDRILEYNKEYVCVVKMYGLGSSLDWSKIPYFRVEVEILWV